MQTLLTLDTQLFKFLNGFVGKSYLQDEIILFFARYYIFVCVAVFLYFLYVGYEHSKLRKIYLHILAIVSALIAVFVVSSPIKFFSHRLRPFQALHTYALFQPTSYAFPSGHTIFMFALATGVYFYNKKLAYFLYISGCIIGITRVMAGVHYPLDIIGGIIFGVITGLIVEFIYRKIVKHTRYSRG